MSVSLCAKSLILQARTSLVLRGGIRVLIHTVKTYSRQSSKKAVLYGLFKEEMDLMHP
jgi:hypothetical protein